MTISVEKPSSDAQSGGKVPLVELKNIGKSYGNITNYNSYYYYGSSSYCYHD